MTLYMLIKSSLHLVRTSGSKLGRALLGLLFFVSGVGILLGGTTGTAAYFSSVGIPLAGVVVWLVIIVKIGAGGALLIGKRTTEASAVLILFTLLATLLGHLNPFDLTAVLKNLAIVGGLLYVMAFGPHGMNVSGTETE
jgi:putative oxidoreductase